MSFFDDLPEPVPEPLQKYVEPEWHRVPYELVPTVLPIHAVVHRTDEVALIVRNVNVYPNGLTFTVLLTRHPEREPRVGDAPMHEALNGGPGRSRNETLRIGVLHADGTRGTFHERFDTSGPPKAALTSRGGGGSNDYATTEIWAWPLPSAGDLTLVFRWREEGLDDTHFVIAEADLERAAGAATEIWPGVTVTPPDPDPAPNGWDAYRR